MLISKKMSSPLYKQMLTNISNDLKELKDFKNQTQITFNLVINELFNLRDLVEKIDKRTESYPKLYENVDKLVKEIEENRQERLFIMKNLRNHEIRIGNLEKTLS